MNSENMLLLKEIETLEKDGESYEIRAKEKKEEEEERKRELKEARK